MNSYAEAARRRKATRLLTALDASVRASGRDPIADGEYVANMILLASAEWWHALAESAKCNPPSKDTIEMIARDVRRRAADHISEMTASVDDYEDWPIT